MVNLSPTSSCEVGLEEESVRAVRSRRDLPIGFNLGVEISCKRIPTQLQPNEYTVVGKGRRYCKSFCACENNNPHNQRTEYALV